MSVHSSNNRRVTREDLSDNLRAIRPLARHATEARRVERIAAQLSAEREERVPTTPPRNYTHVTHGRTVFDENGIPQAPRRQAVRPNLPVPLAPLNLNLQFNVLAAIEPFEPEQEI